jgi:hypothetical protein
MRTGICVVLLFAAVMLLSSGTPAWADGCIVHPPLVEPPLEGGEFIEPAQRCFIVDAGDGVEAMVLQVTFGKADLSEFGWLIPLPSVPEVREESQAVFDSLYNLTYPRTYYSTNGGCFGGGSTLEPPPLWGEDGAGRVDVIESQVVGNYDVFTVAADDPDDLKQWIENNGYIVPEGYESVFQCYINKGWIFVAIKVHLPEEITWYDGYYGPASYPIQYAVLHPLFFMFETDELVYPMLISKLNGGSTDLTMFVLADHRMQFKDSKQKWAGWIKEEDFADYAPLEFYVRGTRFLTRLRRVYFWEDDYDADLYLSAAPNDVEERHGAVELPTNFLMLGFLAAGFPLLGKAGRRRKKGA